MSVKITRLTNKLVVAMEAKYEQAGSRRFQNPNEKCRPFNSL